MFSVAHKAVAFKQSIMRSLISSEGNKSCSEIPFPALLSRLFGGFERTRSIVSTRLSPVSVHAILSDDELPCFIHYIMLSRHRIEWTLMSLCF